MSKRKKIDSIGLMVFIIGIVVYTQFIIYLLR
jgi:hypothetical protein